MTKPTFNAFLSHRYRSQDVNLRFFSTLSAHGNIRFAVDVGTKATNVTRLEKLVRDADAFVGIYPFPSDAGTRPDRSTALKESRYFRLELDLAARAKRPAIVFVDSRYGNTIVAPASTRVFQYEPHEVSDGFSDSRGAELDRLVHDYCSDVSAAMRQSVAEARSARRNRVGLILPANEALSPAHSNALREVLETRLTQLSLEVLPVRSTAGVDTGFVRQLETLDWAIVDIGAESCGSGIPAFLHGYFVPQVRLVHGNETATRSPLESTLLSPFDVGYPKDIVRWSDADSLDQEFVKRLVTLYGPQDHISTADQAGAYFNSASKRKETVFLSYSGENQQLASTMAAPLRETFQDVFDYRDQGKSIVPGRRWLDEVFDKLSASAVGVPLLSAAYLRSGNCLHEAQHMVALADSGKLRLIPVKIEEGTLELPAWIQHTQYLRGWEYSSPAALVAGLVRAVEAS